MRLGIVDIGTLSLRFDIFETEPPFSDASLIERYRSMPRIGSVRDEAAFAKIIAEFTHVQSLARDFRVELLRVVGTSALRDPGGAVLVERIRKETGIQIEVIPGDDEARLTALGIFTNERDLSGNNLLLDIGGGSTELSFCSQAKIQRAFSFQTGASRLEQQFFASLSSAPSTASLDAAISSVRSLIQEAKEFAQTFPIQLALGSSGTIRTLERLQISRPSHLLTKADLEHFVARLSALSPGEIREIPGVEANRADVLLPGCLILLTAMRELNLPAIRVTHFSLRHGVLEEELQKLQDTEK